MFGRKKNTTSTPPAEGLYGNEIAKGSIALLMDEDGTPDPEATIRILLPDGIPAAGRVMLTRMLAVAFHEAAVSLMKNEATIRKHLSDDDYNEADPIALSMGDDPVAGFFDDEPVHEGSDPR